MDFKSILTEEELASVPQGVLTKLESAYRAELASAVEAESAKTTKRFNKMLECVQAKAEEKINKAVMENVQKASANAMSDKLYQVVQGITALIEGAGIPTSEATKKLKEELAQCNVNLKKAYAEREHIKQQLNEQEKKNYIYKEVQGLRPEIVDAVMQHFIHFDIREIDREAIAKFIDGKSNDAYMMDVDPDSDGELNIDKVTAALSEIDHDLELDVPSLPSRKGGEAPKKKGRFESITRGLSPERVALGTPNVTFEALNNMSVTPVSDDDDVADALAQFNEIANMGSMGFI